MIKKVILALSLLLAAAAPAAAQFADQATYVGAGAGTANAQTLTLANASSYADLLGVIIKYTPGATNTGAATLTVNGFGSSPSFRKPNGAGVTALTGGELVVGQPTMVMYDGTYFNIMGPVALPIGAAQLQRSALSFGMPVNLQINATVSANALTIAIKGNDGNDPSATNPVLIPFRNVTIANGQPSIVSLTSALSFTIASTSTMGCTDAQMCRLWIFTMNNGGVIVLGAFNARSGTNVAPMNEAALQTCASGTSGGSSAQTYYCSTSAVTAKAIRIIGYVDVQEVTAGTWASGPTYVQLFGPGIKRPGDVVQMFQMSTTSNTTSTLNTFATTAVTQAITPTSAANSVKITVLGTLTNSSAASIQAFLGIFRTSTQVGNSMVYNIGSTGTGVGPILPVSNIWIDVPNTTSSTTYTAEIKNSDNAATVGFPTTNGGSMILEEIMGALPEPANDNGMIRMVG